MYNNFFKKKFKIGNFLIGKKPFIIAEIGSNHNGNLNLAIQHIIEAKKSGANAVKFQIFESAFFYKKKDKNYHFLRKYEFKKIWINRGLNPGPTACKAGVIPLHHSPKYIIYYNHLKSNQIIFILKI